MEASAMGQPITTELLFTNDAQTPLGRLTLAGLIKLSAGVRGPTMRVLGSYALVYVLEGSGDYQDQYGRAFRVRAGDLLVLFPDIGHQYGPGEHEHWSEWYCVFDGPVFDLWQRAGLLHPDHPVRHLEPIDEWRTRFESVLQPGLRSAAERTVNLSRFLALLTEALLASSGTPVPALPSAIARACQLLESDLHQDTDLVEVAGEVGLAYETFRKQFRQAMGVSPGRYRLIRRIDAACVMLQHTELSVKDIAQRVGFGDEFHFSRSFKQVTGLPPSTFRRRLPELHLAGEGRQALL
jgi:AraC-like DNA-binding protein